MAFKSFEELFKDLCIDLQGRNPEDVPKSDIRKAFLKLANENHPDKFSGKAEELRKAAEERFKHISFAYDTLKDDTKIAAHRSDIAREARMNAYRRSQEEAARRAQQEAASGHGQNRSSSSTHSGTTAEEAARRARAQQEAQRRAEEAMRQRAEEAQRRAEEFTRQRAEAESAASRASASNPSARGNRGGGRSGGSGGGYGGGSGRSWSSAVSREQNLFEKAIYDAHGSLHMGKLTAWIAGACVLGAMLQDHMREQEKKGWLENMQAARAGIAPSDMLR